MNKINSKERVKLALEHKEIDRIPFSLGFGINQPAKENLKEYLKIHSIEKVDKLLLSYSDVRYVSPEYKGSHDV